MLLCSSILLNAKNIDTNKIDQIIEMYVLEQGICTLKNLDNLYNQHYPTFYHGYENNKSLEANNKHIRDRLLELIESCELKDQLSKIIEFHHFVNEQDYKKFSDLELESINNKFLKDFENFPEGATKNEFIFKIYGFIHQFHIDRWNFKKASNEMNKILDYSENIQIGSYETALQYGLFHRIENEPNENLLRDILHLKRFYMAYGKIGEFYVNKMNLALAKYFIQTEQVDSAKHYLKLLPPSFMKQMYVSTNKVHYDISMFENKHSKAESILYDILERAKNTKPHTIKEYLLIGNHFLKLEKAEAANKAFQTAMDQCQLSQGDISLYTNIIDYTTALIGLIESNLQLKQFDNQKELIQKAKELIDRQFSELDNQKDKILLLNNFSKLFSLIFRYRTHLNLHEDDLLNYSENARAYALLDGIKYGTQIRERLTELEFKNYVNFLKMIDKLETQKKTDLSLDALQISELDKRKGQHLKSIDSLRQTIGQSIYEAFDFDQVKDISYHQTVLEYYLLDSTGLVFIINDGLIKIHEIQLSSREHSNINKFKSLISDPSSELSDFKNTSKKLYNFLIGDLAQDFKDNLLIIPHSTISSIPFEALVDEQGQFLVSEYNINYAYSLGVQNKMRQHDCSSDGFLGFAPSYNFKASVKKLRVLNHNKRELESIKNMLKSTKCFFGKDASKARFHKHAKEHGIIHIAGHADVNSSDEDLSYIAFSDHTGDPDSTLLYLSNLYSTQLNPELIVLSACNTGLGTYQSGEGILSIARGFVHAGTASIVSTLWEVDDRATSDIMINFYNHLQNSKNKDHALSLAKRDYLNKNENQHPYYWAGSIFIGDSSPFENLGQTPWIFVLLIVLAFLLLIFFFRKSQRGA